MIAGKIAGTNVFVGRDSTLDDVFDQVARELELRGCVVVRQSAPRKLATRLDIYDVLCINSRTRVSADHLRQATRLRGIVYASNGCDSCDLETAHKLGIAVRTGATDQNVRGMAEATVMLMSALFLELPRKERILANREPRPHAYAVGSRLLSGSTVGFVGFGRIATTAVELLAGWAPARIVVHTRTPEATAWPGVDFVSLERVFEESDIVSINVPLTAQTRHLVDRRLLARMKPSAYLISASRGGIVCEPDLIHALRTGGIAGAALDVFETEPLPADSPLRELKNVILTPHMIGHTSEMFRSLARRAVDNVVALCEGPRRQFR